VAARPPEGIRAGVFRPFYFSPGDEMPARQINEIEFGRAGIEATRVQKVHLIIILHIHHSLR